MSEKIPHRLGVAGRVLQHGEMAGVLQDERACFFGVRPDPNDKANNEFLGAGVGAYKA